MVADSATAEATAEATAATVAVVRLRPHNRWTATVRNYPNQSFEMHWHLIPTFRHRSLRHDSTQMI